MFSAASKLSYACPIQKNEPNADAVNYELICIAQPTSSFKGILTFKQHIFIGDSPTTTNLYTYFNYKHNGTQFSKAFDLVDNEIYTGKLSGYGIRI